MVVPRIVVDTLALMNTLEDHILPSVDTTFQCRCRILHPIQHKRALQGERELRHASDAQLQAVQ